MAEFTMTIGGRAAPTERTFDVINPATGEAFAVAPDCTPRQLDSAMGSAVKAFRDWRADEGRRRDALRAAAGVLRSSSQELAAVLTAEQGKPISDANSEILAAAVWLQYYARLGHPPGGHSGRRVSLRGGPAQAARRGGGDHRATARRSARPEG